MTGSEFINSTGLDRHNFGKQVHDDIVIPRMQNGETLEDVWEDLGLAEKWCFNEFITNRARRAEVFVEGNFKPFLGDITLG